MATVFPNEIVEDNPEIYERALRNPIWEWVAQYITADNGHPSPLAHLQIYEMLHAAPPRCALRAFRSFAKSTIFKNYLCYLAYKHAKYTALYGPQDAGLWPEFIHSAVLFISNSGPRARALLRQVRIELEFNDLITAECGPLKGEKWTEEFIETTSGFTVRALGRGQQVRGWRPTLLLMDDLDDDEEVLSDEQLEKAFDWIDGAVINTLDEEDCQAFCLGTPVEEVCILNYLCEKPGWITHDFPAMDEEEVTAVWPSKWPIARLRQRREEIGYKKFMAEFMLQPIPSENPIFERAWFREYDHTTDFFREILTRGVYTVVAIDPAISREEGADYTAIVTLSATVEERPKIFVRVGENRCDHLTMGQTVTEGWKIYNSIQASKFVIETNAYQKVLADEFRLYFDHHRINATIEEVIADTDKERRALAVQPMVQHGQVFVDFADPLAHRLVTQCVQYRRGKKNIKKDLMDAFVYGLMAIRRWSMRARPSGEGGRKVLPKGSRVHPRTGVIL